MAKDSSGCYHNITIYPNGVPTKKRVLFKPLFTEKNIKLLEKYLEKRR